MIRQLFGSKSEKIDPNQLMLILGMDEMSPEDEPEDDPPPPEPPKSKRKRRQFKDRLPDNLPVRMNFIDPPEVTAEPENYRYQAYRSFNLSRDKQDRYRLFACWAHARRKFVGKKNWLFFGSPDSGWQSAVIFSILETYRKLGIDQQAYLQDVLNQLPSLTVQEAKILTPARWHAKRAQVAA